MSADTLNAARRHRDAIVELTRRWITIPTENPPGDFYPEGKQAILEALTALRFDEIQSVGDCILCFTGSGERTLYFSGHYDVVPAQSRDQFQAALRGANLFGRGSSDMKGGLAAMIYAAIILRDSGYAGRTGLVFVPDEETAGARGSRMLVDQALLGKNAIGMLTPEPTGGVVWNANRGAITLKITVNGKSAHVALQSDGVNAFERMIPVAHRLLQLKEEVEKAGSILMVGGQAESGSNFNVVPARCWFTVDRRINPEENLAQEKQRLLDVLRDVDVEILQEAASAASSARTPLALALAGSIQRITGRAAQFEMCPGLLETRFYAAQGIPAFAYGPGLLTVSHGPNEFVPIERMVECAAIYAETAANIR